MHFNYHINYQENDFLAGLVVLPPRETPWRGQRVPDPKARAARARRILEAQRDR